MHWQLPGSCLPVIRLTPPPVKKILYAWPALPIVIKAPSPWRGSMKNIIADSERQRERIEVLEEAFPVERKGNDQKRGSIGYGKAHSTSGASLSIVGPRTISRVHTSRTRPTAHPRDRK